MNSFYFNNLAKQKLDGRWNKLALAYFIYSAILAAISGIGTGISFSADFLAFLSAISVIASIIVSGPLFFGLIRIISNISDGKDFEIAQLFSGFKEAFGKCIVLYILKNLFVFLWSLLFIIPGIVKLYAYRLAFYLLHDNNIDTLQAIKLSDQIMKGNKWRLFCLDFSYLGWFLLSLLTFGILFFWVIPKHELATFEFYRELTKTDEHDELFASNSSDKINNSCDGDFVL